MQRSFSIVAMSSNEISTPDNSALFLNQEILDILSGNMLYFRVHVETMLDSRGKKKAEFAVTIMRVRGGHTLNPLFSRASVRATALTLVETFGTIATGTCTRGNCTR